MNDATVIELASEEVAARLREQLRQVEQRNDELHRHIQQLVAERVDDGYVELEEELGDLEDFAHALLVAQQEIAEYALTLEKGNPQALRDWYNDGAKGEINWGSPGDFDRCVSIAGKYLSNPQGFCQLRHIEATGHPAGKAPGEQRK